MFTVYVLTVLWYLIGSDSRWYYNKKLLFMIISFGRVDILQKKVSHNYSLKSSIFSLTHKERKFLLVEAYLKNL